MLRLYQGNQLEELAVSLSGLLSKPSGAVMSAQTVVAPNSGMKRWLSLFLAERLGICANVRFPLPAAFAWEVFHAVLPDVPEVSPYQPETLTWRLIPLLRTLEHRTGFESLAHYLQSGDETRFYDLAWRLAEVFDQYLVFRPEWVDRWAAGEESHWQARLWRDLIQSAGDRHWARLQRETLQALDGTVPADGLPERVMIFAVPTFSPGYLALLQQLAELIDVHLFLLNPCREYWGDIVPGRSRDRRAVREPEAASYLETGNDLLASMGRQGRDLLDMLVECEPVETDLFASPGQDSLLHCLQNDMLELRNPGAPGSPIRDVSETDSSIQLHVCHSPVREIEVLHDQLLAMFEANPGLEPADVLIMTPDLKVFAPAIDSIFGASPKGAFIPYSIADRTLGAESGILGAFLALLELPQSRYDSDRLAGLLDIAAVRRRFGIQDADTPVIHRWIRDTGIRWGRDAKSRAELGLPSTDANTWKAGLKRMLLGIALVDEHRVFDDVLPYSAIEGTEAALLGRLCTYIEAVFQLGDQLGSARTPRDWVSFLEKMLDRFLLVDQDQEEDVQQLRFVLDGWLQSTGSAGFDSLIGLPLVRQHLIRKLAREPVRGRFLVGGVTFCAMVPMRSIPFQVIGMVGMDYDRFPRPRSSTGLDLMAAEPRRGDRSHRDDERQLFLEALLSARQTLYISYSGRDIRDNSVRPPSVLVSELMDYLDRGYRMPAGVPAGRALLLEHPLQPFSPRYFTGGERLFSYSEELRDAVVGAAQPRQEASPFIVGNLPAPDAGWRQVSLEQLIRFFRSPARYLAQRRLGIYLDEADGPLDNREPFTLDFLARRKVATAILQAQFAGQPDAEVRAMLRASGDLPQGQVGRIVMEQQCAVVGRLVDRMASEHAVGASHHPIAVDLTSGEFRLLGELRNVSEHGLLDYDVDTLRPWHRISLWLRHLALNVCAPAGVSPHSRWLGFDSGTVLHPIADARDLLEKMLDLYWQGLSRPIHFFPKTSLAFVAKVHTGKPQQAMDAARKAWLGNDFSPGEGGGAYYRLMFPDAAVLDEAFRALAVEVLEPMFACEEQE